MADPLLPSIVLTGFSIAFLHVALPTHWLPFVLAGRAQGWTGAKTLAVTALAGFGHIVSTTLLGALIVLFGQEAESLTGFEFHPVAGVFLLCFGLYYLWRHSRGLGCIACRHGMDDHHEHNGHDHPHGHHHAPKSGSDKTVIIGLFLMLTFSPCEGSLPVYLSVIQYGWAGFFLFSVVLGIAVMAGMLIFTFLTWHGLERLKLNRLEKYDALIVGGLLCLLGVFVLAGGH